jgi:glycosyltransferase involved in cell wall biosynthesis
VQGLRSADALIAISRFTREGFTRLCPQAVSHIVDIPNGVHLAAYTERAMKPTGFDFSLEPKSFAVFLGRLKARKGVDVLLHALARIPANGKVQMVVVGDGEERANLESLSAQLGVADRVQFLGKVTGPAKSYLLQNARFGVIPSRQWESFGLVVLEGYASGLPMIASDMPGLADLIEPEKTGLLVPPESPELLAAAIQRLFTEDALVARMSRAAEQVVQQYDWHHIANRHVALYQSLIAGRRALAA